MGWTDDLGVIRRDLNASHNENHTGSSGGLFLKPIAYVERSGSIFKTLHPFVAALPDWERTMYAIVKTGGKQYMVSEGDTVQVERLPGEVGDHVDLTDVLFIGGEEESLIGAPMVSGAKVTGEIISQTRDKKILVFKFKRRKGYRKKQGHRQDITKLKIDRIFSGRDGDDVAAEPPMEATVPEEASGAETPEAVTVEVES